MSVSRVAVENPPPVPQRRKKPSVSNKTTKSKNNPLIFTLQDFENVMDSSSKSVALSTSDMETCTVNKDNEEEEEVEFRVTTTNFPFEKCFDNVNSNDSAWLPVTPKKSPIKPRRIGESQSPKIQIHSKLNSNELKTEMLNELLNNFTSIKLKEIPSLNDGKIKCELDNEKNIIIEKNDSACSVDKKTDNIDLAIESCDRNGKSTAKPIGKPEIIISTAINSSQALRDDICAIVSYNNDNINNNNDNNTSTVPIIFDQTSHNAVTISVSPGRVKSYVKYYDEQPTDSGSFKNTEGGVVRVLSSAASASTLKNDAKVYEKKLGPPVAPKSPCLKNSTASGVGSNLKKSVKFNSTSGSNSSTKIKRKAPPRPPMAAENTTSNQTLDVDADTTAIQGTKSDFVIKPPYVFYYQL